MVVQKLVRGTVVLICLFAVSCGSDSTPTSPTTPITPPVTIAPPTTTEEFTGTVPVSGLKFYSFSVGEQGTVNLTLTAVSGQFVPSTVTLGLGLGVPEGVDCATTVTISTRAGASPQLTGTYVAGVYCAKVFDVGNLFGPADFAVSIAHP